MNLVFPRRRRTGPKPRLRLGSFPGAMRRLPGWIVAQIVLLVPALAPGAVAATLRRDIPYAQVDGQTLLLDASTPDGTGPFPVAILVHGGGWRHGDKAGSDHPGDPADITPWFAPLTAARFTWFSIDYRFVPRSPWPAPFEDLQTAIRWVKAHAAEFKGDPRRIALFGHSAGGHLAALAATNGTRATRVQALVLFAGALDFPSPLLPYAGHLERMPTATPQERRLKTDLELYTSDGLVPIYPAAAEHRARISPTSLAVCRDPWPLDQATADMPPVLLIHGELDRTVPIGVSRAFQTRLVSAGVPCELIAVRNAPHSLIDGIKADPSYRPKMIAWLRRNLRPDPPAPGAGPANVVVASDGSGDFRTVQGALDSIPRDNPQPRVILVKEGIYPEQIRMQSPRVTLRGESRRNSRIACSPDAGRAVVTIEAAECGLENLSVENTQVAHDRRAPAVRSEGNRTLMLDCDVLSEGQGALELGGRRTQSYLARLALRGAGDVLSWSGDCLVTDSTISTVAPHAEVVLGHRVAADGDQRLVMRNCRFDGAPDGLLLDAHDPGSNARAYFVDCRFSSALAGGRPGKSGAFCFNCDWVGKDPQWTATTPLPAAALEAPAWTGGGKWRLAAPAPQRR